MDTLPLVGEGFVNHFGLESPRVAGFDLKALIGGEGLPHVNMVTVTFSQGDDLLWLWSCFRLDQFTLFVVKFVMPLVELGRYLVISSGALTPDSFAQRELSAPPVVPTIGSKEFVIWFYILRGVYSYFTLKDFKLTVQEELVK